MSDARRHILDRVAAGDLSPEQAAEELARLDAGTGTLSAGASSGDRDSTTERADDDPPAPGSEPSTATRSTTDDHAPSGRVRILASAVAVRVIADPEIATVDVEGEGHTITSEGDTTVVTVNPIESTWIDEHGDDAGIGRGVVVIGTKRGTKRFRLSGLAGGRGQRTTVRVNPHLPLELDTSAGSATVEGLRAGLDLHASAAKVDVDDFRGHLTGAVNAGKLAARGIFTGESEISADASSVTVDLEPGSDVTVSAEMQLSSLHIGAERRPHPDTGEKAFFVGRGRGRFHVRGSMSKVHIDATDA